MLKKGKRRMRRREKKRETFSSFYFTLLFRLFIFIFFFIFFSHLLCSKATNLLESQNLFTFHSFLHLFISFSLSFSLSFPFSMIIIFPYLCIFALNLICFKKFWFNLKRLKGKIFGLKYEYKCNFKQLHCLTN